MSTDHDPDLPHDEAADVGLPIWKKLLLGVAALFVLSGVALNLTADEPEPAPGVTLNGPQGFAASSFVPGSLAPTSVAGTEGSPWAPFLMKGGFSLFLGFCIGYALRTFFKVSAIAVGMLALALFALSYFGIIDVDWDALSGHYDTFVAKVRDEASEFRTFVSGSLPSAGMASFGTFAGFKRG